MCGRNRRIVIILSLSYKHILVFESALTPIIRDFLLLQETSWFFKSIVAFIGSYSFFKRRLPLINVCGVGLIRMISLLMNF